MVDALDQSLALGVLALLGVPVLVATAWEFFKEISR
jgi:hypothetical protein